ncbi:MAG TPA: hypothetical protein VJT15_02570 [Pyrinomonadaceae bacterium]|nr:hypothetical protein [Pyrinomonadaceae bacterium]
MDLIAINNRVDGALRDNRRAEFIVIGMAVGIFLLGAGCLVIAYWLTNPYVGGGAFLFQSLLYWPIREILRVRQDNLVLQTLPVLVAELQPKDATIEIRKLAEFMRDRR